MLSSINPLGERARRNRWWLTVTAYVIGSTAGGLAAGALAGVAGRALRAGVAAIGPGGGSYRSLAYGLAIGACLFGAFVDADLPIKLPLPTVHRQVNEDWLNRYRGWVYGIGFGFQLGLGVVTIVTTSAVHVSLVLALTLGWTVASAPGAGLAGAVVGATFGLARAVPLLSGAGSSGPDGLRAAHRRLVAIDPMANAVTVGVMALAAATLALVELRG